MNDHKSALLNTRELRLRLNAVQYAVQRGYSEQARNDLLRTAGLLYRQAAAAMSAGSAARDLMRGDRCHALARQLLPQALQKDQVMPARPVSIFDDKASTLPSSQPPPDLDLSDVVGMESIKAQFRARYVYPIQKPALAKRFGLAGGGGILLYGLPGTGKTHLVRCLAGELQLPTYTLSPATLLSKWVGQTEQKLAQVFAAARSHPDGALVFIDEVDGLASDRDQGEGNGLMQRLLSQLLTELDGFANDASRVRFIGATNRPWAVDPALLRAGRFDVLELVDLPDESTRRALLEHALRPLPCAPGLDLAKVAGRLENYSAKEVTAVAAVAAQQAFVDEIERDGPQSISSEHLLAAADRVHRMATPEQIERLKAFAESHGLGHQLRVRAAEISNLPLSNRRFRRRHRSVPDVPPVAPFEFVHARDLDVTVEAAPFISYALCQSGISPVQRLVIRNQGKEPSQNLIVEVRLVPEEFGSAWVGNIAELPAGGQWQTDNVSLPLRLERLRAMQERETLQLQYIIRDKDEILHANTQDIRVLAYNEWVYHPDVLDVTAAFVQSNSPSLGLVMKPATKRLKQSAGSTSFCGYQRQDPAYVKQMLEAIHDALEKDLGITYINPPPSFEMTGQKIRLVADTLEQGRGTCLDLAVLQAALWEHIGLHPVIILVPGHALLGCWLIERKWEVLRDTASVLRLDQAEGRNVLEALSRGEVLLINSTEIANGMDFETACRHGQHYVDQGLVQEGHVYWIDIAAARRDVAPLP